ncbi:MAG: C40 family peptidase [Sphingobium sp.]|uniref:C40 family peptidase n=1 Tax=Sphingobium sp. TaxID=1912891 RepID=UPI0029AC61A4|nr:C40 family peptidase [Sphingobium sp.]MDX3910370.1 C40 family peptidase [Sphingobium sp.]
MKSIAKRAAATKTDRTRFRLQGRSAVLDKRIHAIRSDLADVSLAGVLFSAHYAQAAEMSCVAPGTPVRAGKSLSAECVSQLLRGEIFHVLDVNAEWAWGFCGHDGYVGYVRREALDVREIATHRVTAALAPVFAEPDIKSRIVDAWPRGSLFPATSEDAFLHCAEGYVHSRQAAAVETAETDWVAVAERYIGQPYIWGGRGYQGVDCSGLVQTALGQCGRAVPRDTDLQREGIGNPLPDGAALQRGDLVFFPGHVGVMVDETQMLHANAFWMATVIEPLADVIARLKPDHDQPVLARRRIDS